jgi:glutathione S-transferase
MFFAPLTLNEGAKNEVYAKFNTHVDATFSAHVVLVAQYMPLNPDTADAIKAQMCKRAHLDSWDSICIQGEPREQLKAAFNMALKSLADFFAIHEEGPFLEGDKANYADLIVGGWVNMMASCLPAEEWDEFRTWHGGVFGRLHDALHEKYFVCV